METYFGKILVIDDDQATSKYFEGVTKGKIKIISAYTISEGEKKFFEVINEIDFVAVDACIESNHPDSMDLIKKIVNSGFDRPIIAISSDDSFNNILLSAGATKKFLKPLSAMAMMREFVKHHRIINENISAND